jgi:hypothetical protein
MPAPPDGDLKLCDVFDPDNRIDRFVFLLSETVADLGNMESRLKANLFGEDTSVAHSLYLQRHLAARLVDSWRAIAAIRDYEEIRHFVAEAGATDDADWLIEMLTKKLGSKEKTPVEKLFYVERQRTIHLASVDDDELRKTLEAAGEEVAQIGLFHGDEKMVIEFPEAALTRAVFGDPNEPAGEQALERRSALIEETLRRFGRLWGKSLTLLLTRREIHPTRLHVVRQEPQTSTRGIPALLHRVADWLKARR